MSEDEKRKVSLINTASGRAALRGKVNKFGTRDARPNEKKVLYDKFKSVMNEGGGQEESTTEGMVSDISVCLLYTSPSPRDVLESRMPSSA